jgi:hypothetical protein
MPFYEANAAQTCTFVQPRSESEITHAGSLHNAEILSAVLPVAKAVTFHTFWLEVMENSFGILG